MHCKMRTQVVLFDIYFYIHICFKFIFTQLPRATASLNLHNVPTQCQHLGCPRAPSPNLEARGKSLILLCLGYVGKHLSKCLPCTPHVRNCQVKCSLLVAPNKMGMWGMEGWGDTQTASGMFWIQPKAVPCDRFESLGLISFQGVCRK